MTKYQCCVCFAQPRSPVTSFSHPVLPTRTPCFSDGLGEFPCSLSTQIIHPFLPCSSLFHDLNELWAMFSWQELFSFSLWRWLTESKVMNSVFCFFVNSIMMSQNRGCIWRFFSGSHHSFIRKWCAWRLLTFWRRNYFFNFSTPVYKMWIIQEPNTLELWNKLHFEEKRTESIYHV